MSHFTNITSFSELKTQYRILAFAHHPDRGGDLRTMQAVNAEYDKLHAIWFARSAEYRDGQNMDGAAYRSEFYTANGWKGDNYDPRLPTRDITAFIRNFLKAAFPNTRWSVRKNDYSSITLALMAADVSPFVPLFDVPENFRGSVERGYVQVNDYHIETSDYLTGAAKAMLGRVIGFANSYNRDDSDSSIDYFDKRFYLNVHIGAWNKPFEVKPRKLKAA